MATKILRYLCVHSEASTEELAKTLMLSINMVSSVLKKLQKEGVVCTSQKEDTIG
jgi:DNA-binding MarR family transcriptional regulator